MDWRMANVSPLYKKGKRSLAENYRPVSSVGACVADTNARGHSLTHSLLRLTS